MMNVVVRAPWNIKTRILTAGCWQLVITKKDALDLEYHKTGYSAPTVGIVTSWSSFSRVFHNRPRLVSRVTLTNTDPVTIESSECECKAGDGHCSHSVGLLYLLCHFLKLGLKSVPAIQSKTSLPQTWHIPQRTEGLSHKPVDSLQINKIKPGHEPTKRRRVAEGILPNVYCPVPTPVPSAAFTTSLVEQLAAIKSDAQILKVLPMSPDPPSVSSKFGLVPYGSVLSYQQRLEQRTGDIILHLGHPSFPAFGLPRQTSSYHRVLSQAEQEVFYGLHLSAEQAEDIEITTRDQSMNKTWHDVRKNRLTSSVFKQIVVRQKDHVTLARRLLSGKNIQTAAMKYGISHEPEAAKLYADITGNNVYMCGFVINPSAPHLGTSPDRKVLQPNADNPHGLLEIKCPDKDIFADCPYLKKTSTGSYKLKNTHDYYHQVMGQMALTGMEWCDFLVKCRNDYHLERIVYDNDFWVEMKTALDSFYFQYYLPEFCKV